MQFRDFIYYLSALLQNNGFEIVETSQNYVRFDSASTTVTIANDPRDRQYFVQAGVKNKELYELEPEGMKEVFGFDTGELHPADYFIKFFQQNENPLLKGNREIIEKLKRFIFQRSQEYWQKTTEQLHLREADSAWKSKDYRGFINSIAKIDSTRLLESYKEKYRIALAKVDK
jgi:hypothetical protein